MSLLPFSLLVLALIAGGYCADKCPSIQQDTEPFSDDEISAMFACLGDGKNFNGKKTCQVGCRVACQQPGCGGFKTCDQVPNPGETSTYLHKYTCRCNSA